MNLQHKGKGAALGQAPEKGAGFLELLGSVMDQALDGKREAPARDGGHPAQRPVADALAAPEGLRDRSARWAVEEAPAVEEDLRVVQERQQRPEEPGRLQVLEMALQELALRSRQA